jgi:hypothetical protein
MLLGGDDEVALMYAEIFNCSVGIFPLKYLRVPISAARLHVTDWIKLEEKSAKKMDVWQGGSLSMGGRKELINSSLSNSSIYHMSMFLIPKTNIKRLDKLRRTFFWQGGQLKKKYHLVGWPKICKNKKKGGLGIKNLRKLNVSLLCKWWWLLQNRNGLWQDIVKLKYVKGAHVGLIKNKMSDSPVWSDLMKIRHIYLRGREYKINNGKLISFWTDSWLGKVPICVEYPLLYEQCTNQNISVEKVAHDGWVIHFKVSLSPIFRDQWYNLAQKLNEVVLNENMNIVVWKWAA